jgi:hypothetical protein
MLLDWSPESSDSDVPLYALGRQGAPVLVHASRATDCREHLARLVDRRQIDKPDPVDSAVPVLGRGAHREPGLPSSGRAGHGYQAHASRVQ